MTKGPRIFFLLCVLFFFWITCIYLFNNSFIEFILYLVLTAGEGSNVLCLMLGRWGDMLCNSQYALSLFGWFKSLVLRLIWFLFAVYMYIYDSCTSIITFNIRHMIKQLIILSLNYRLCFLCIIITLIKILLINVRVYISHNCTVWCIIMIFLVFFNKKYLVSLTVC